MQLTRSVFLRKMPIVALGVGSLAKTLISAQEKSQVPERSREISGIDIFPCDLEQNVIARGALGSISKTHNVWIRLRTRDGVTGWGECSPFGFVTGETQEGAVAMARQLSDVVRGRDPFRIAETVDKMDTATEGNQGIKAAFEMALWDICGKIAAQPVSCLLGHYRDSFETDITILLDTTSAMARAANDFHSKGFRALKIKVGESPELDIERVSAIRDTVGPDVQLRVDANQGWTPSEAIRVLQILEKRNLQWCEQPVASWDWEGMRRVRESVGMPIMADESVHQPHDLIDGLRRNALDMVNIKLMKAGGVLRAMQIGYIAEAANLRCMVGCFSETRMGLTAAAHVIASQKNILYADLDTAIFVFKIDPIIGGIEYRGSTVVLPQAPGLGLDVDPSFLKSLRSVS